MPEESSLRYARQRSALPEVSLFSYRTLPAEPSRKHLEISYERHLKSAALGGLPMVG